MNDIDTDDPPRHDTLSRIDRAALVDLLAAYYRDVGWWVERIGAGPLCDAGIDLTIRRDQDYVLVSAAYWSMEQVTDQAVNALHRVMTEAGASGAILLSSGRFTNVVIDTARLLPRLRLIDSEALHGLLGPLSDAIVNLVPQSAVSSALISSGSTFQTAPRIRLWVILVAMSCAIGCALMIVWALDRNVEPADEPATVPMRP